MHCNTLPEMSTNRGSSIFSPTADGLLTIFGQAADGLGASYEQEILSSAYEVRNVEKNLVRQLTYRDCFRRKYPVPKDRVWKAGFEQHYGSGR